MTDRAPPINIEAECSVLGSIMLLPSVLDEIGFLRADDFHDDAHRLIFQAMLDLRAKGRPVDSLLLFDALKAHGDEAWRGIGGAAYLGKILHAVATPAHAIWHAEQVRNAALLRSTIDVCTEAVREAYSPGGNPLEILGNLESRSLDIIADGAAASESVDLPATVDVVIAEIERRIRGEKIPGLRVGFDSLDDMLSGFKPGQLVILAGRPGMGKSAAALNIALNVALEGELVLFASLEMSAAELAERALCSFARVGSYAMQHGRLSHEERQRIVEASGRLAALPLEINDTSGQRVIQIAAQARRLKRKKGLGLVIVDYLQLLTPDDERVNREQQVARMSRSLKTLARELEVPIVCLAQLNRQADHAGKAGIRPTLSNLRESGAIEQDADIVVFTHRPEYYSGKDAPPQGSSEPAEFVVAKQRGGRQGICHMLWFGSYFTFENKACEWQERRGEVERYSEFDSWNERGDLR